MEETWHKAEARLESHIIKNSAHYVIQRQRESEDKHYVSTK